MGRKKPRWPTRTPEELAAIRKDVILGNSDFMRRDDHPYWVALRRFLREQGIDPNSALIAEDDAHGGLMGGFVVAPDGRVYQYTYDWTDQPLGRGNFTDWTDVTTTWPKLTTDTQGTLHRDLIRVALELREEAQTETAARTDRE